MRRTLAVLCALLITAVVAPQLAQAKPPRRTRVALTGPRQVTVGSVLKLKLKVRTAKGVRVTRYAISFGDKSKRRRGKRLSTRKVSHVYARAGRFVVKLKVTDNQRRTVSARRRITVKAKSQTTPPPPTVVPQTPSSPPPPPAPPARLDLTAAAVTLAPGSQDGVGLPGPLVSVDRLDAQNGQSAGVSASLTTGGALTLAVRSGAQARKATLTVTGDGCTATECGHALTLRVPVTVRPLAAPESTLTAFTAASPDRIAAGAPIDGRGRTLRDELVITLGTPDSPGDRAEADAYAGDVDGVVSGGIDELGIYEIRWASAQDLSDRESTLWAEPNVSNVSETQIGVNGTQALPPGDWNDDGVAVTWPFTMVHAQQAWDESTGRGVTVGIVDENQVFGGHEDLNVIRKFGSQGTALHATHVAGTACAEANGKGVVGFAWSCPIVTSDWYDGSTKKVIQAMTDVVHAGAKVVNMSVGSNVYDSAGKKACATLTDRDAIAASASQHRNEFRQLFRGPVGRDVVWTLSAGNNCEPGVDSDWGRENSDLGNVITVASVNSDGQLSSFSNFGDGVDVAAPGGVGVGANGDGKTGIWSTSVARCLITFWCGSYTNVTERREPIVGTSMAAPVVAGIAALVRAKHPSYGAGRVAGCITGTAGTGGVGSATRRANLPDLGKASSPWHFTFGGSIPIVNAKTAVDCPLLGFSRGPGTGAPPSTLGGYPMTTFSADERPVGVGVSDVPDPAGTIVFDVPLEHLQVPDGWSTWSHGYTGDVYFTGEETDPALEMTMPSGTKAFAFYAEPNRFDGFTVEAIANDGSSSEPVDIEGNSGARYFGFYASPGATIAGIRVTASDPSGFAVGEFQISR